MELDTVTVWDGAWYRTAPDDPWQRASLGGASADAGVDINPLTLVERLRNYLATPGVTPTTRDVACASESGRCHEIRLDAGADPLMILSLMLPHEEAQRLPPTDIVVTLQTDAQTLRPAHLVAEAFAVERPTLDHDRRPEVAPHFRRERLRRRDLQVMAGPCLVRNQRVQSLERMLAQLHRAGFAEPRRGQ